MLFIATGGTVDKQAMYLEDGKTFDNDSKVFVNSHLEEILTKVGCLVEYSVTTVFMIDSLDMTDEHHLLIRNAIEGSEETEFVITHSTDTMPETARFLMAYLTSSFLASKVIVLTGAIIPYSVGVSSDALFNVGQQLLIHSLYHLECISP